MTIESMIWKSTCIKVYSFKKEKMVFKIDLSSQTTVIFLKNVQQDCTVVACVYKTLVSSYNLVSIIFTEGLLFSFEILYSSLCSYKELQNLNDIYRIVNSLNSLLHASLQPKFNFFSHRVVSKN